MDADQQRAVDAILKHDLESTGAELVYYFVHELGIAEREAWQVVIRERKEYIATHPLDDQAVAAQHAGHYSDIMQKPAIMQKAEARGLRRLA
jgi:hypothetical protein